MNANDSSPLPQPYPQNTSAQSKKTDENYTPINQLNTLSSKQTAPDDERQNSALNTSANVPHTASPPSDKKNKEQTPQPEASFFRIYPIDQVQSPLPPSGSSKLFQYLAYCPWLFLFIVIILENSFSFNTRELWFPDEVSIADTFGKLLERGKWLLFEENGKILPTQPSLYFPFLLSLFYLLPAKYQSISFALSLGSTLSVIFFIAASSIYARIVARSDGKTILASGIILLNSFYLLWLMHYGRADLLFTSVVLLSLSAFYYACIAKCAYFTMFSAYLAAGTAFFLSGPLGLLFPLLVACLFTLWRKTPGRLFRKDSLIGAVGGVTLLTSLFLVGCNGLSNIDLFLEQLLQKQLAAITDNILNVTKSWPSDPILFLFLLLPWIFLFVCFPEKPETRKKQHNSEHFDEQKRKNEGSAYLICTLTIALTLFFPFYENKFSCCLAALPAAAIFGARAALRAGRHRLFLLRLLLSLFFSLSGFAIIILTLMLYRIIPLPVSMGKYLWLVQPNMFFFLSGLILLACSAILSLGLGSNRFEGLLLVCVFFTAAASFPINKFVIPAFNTAFSPQAISLILKQYIEKGYSAYTYGEHDGAYNYYARHTIPALDSLKVIDDLLAEQPKIIIASTAKEFQLWHNKPAYCRTIFTQQIAFQDHFLVACQTNMDTFLANEATQRLPGNSRSTNERNQTEQKKNTTVQGLNK